MKILSVNAGSSSLKFNLLEMPQETLIVSGTFEKIGLPGSFYTIKYNGEKIRKEKDLDSHKEAVMTLLIELLDLNIIESYEAIEGVGHRVVHGGSKYNSSVVIGEDVIKTIEELIPLAPLHNPANLLGIRSFMEVLPNTTQVAVFDTAFHQTLNKREFLYPVPYEWYEKFGVRKYGFHGTSHKYIAEFMRENLGEDYKIINCHIGNGASLCAIKDGKSVDTSMGFTPICGVTMGTRCGDIDTAMIPYVMEKTNESLEQVINDLNKNSGMIALSGISSDLRDVEDEYFKGDERSAFAIDIYVRKIVNYVSMYNTLLEGADIITFTAGVGENSDVVREKVCESLKCIGVELDRSANNKLRGEFRKISTSNSKIDVFVVPTNEELMIAKDTYSFLS
jgi:acetate kinase